MRKKLMYVEWYVEGMVVETSFLVKILIEVIEIYWVVVLDCVG